MKLIKITIVTLLIISQNCFATGSDGGNSHPSAQSPTVLPKISEPMQFCLANPQSGEQYCVVVNNENNGETEL